MSQTSFAARGRRMSLVTAAVTLAVVAFLLWRAVVVWRARNRPPPPPSAASAISQLPDPSDVGGL